ncbi:hypothetical protein E2C01_022583 [Portunus trituberculatus]|uniref:Uncharacterized protein n=1 Tax=Portunus trituberculatus TaxID=210409 RepID=A0A5B7E7P0_PORTR|nr:hypothetical protein [Portunus trituberculatus]
MKKGYKYQVLEQRRERGDLIAAYRAMKGLEKLDREDLLIWDTSDTRGHGKKLKRIIAGEISRSSAFHKDVQRCGMV